LSLCLLPLAAKHEPAFFFLLPMARSSGRRGGPQRHRGLSGISWTEPRYRADPQITNRSLAAATNRGYAA